MVRYPVSTKNDKTKGGGRKNSSDTYADYESPCCVSLENDRNFFGSISEGRDMRAQSWGGWVGG
jgi:hypothetical protein